MDYRKIYSSFIDSRRKIESSVKRGYTEKHHIMPRALGGDDSKENIISLTASDHLFAHKLLALIHGGSMWHALHMCNINDSAARGVRLNRRWYELARKKRAEHMKNAMSGDNHHFFGKKFTDEHRRRLSEAHMGKSVGADSPSYDSRKYDFRHKDGRHERMTKGEFISTHPGIPSRSVYAICKGSKKSTHGWYVSTSEVCLKKIEGKGEHHAWFNPTKYLFIHDDGCSVFATQNDFLLENPGLNQSHVSAICSGKRKSHKGWSVKHE